MANRLHPSRDSEGYPWHARPADHNQAGLFLYGPEGERNPLAILISYTHCRDDAEDPREALRSMRLRRLIGAMHGKRTRNRKAA
jgi:hypothetical protein